MKIFLQIRNLILSISGHPPLSKGLKTYVGIPLWTYYNTTKRTGILIDKWENCNSNEISEAK